MLNLTPDMLQGLATAALPIVGGGVGYLASRLAVGAPTGKPGQTLTHDELTWEKVQEDGRTVSTVGGGFFRVYKAAGAIEIGKNERQREALWQQKFRWLKNIRNHPVDVRFVFPRRRISVPPPPPHAKGFLARQDAAWHEHLTNVWTTDFYIMISVEVRGQMSALNQIDETIANDLAAFGIEPIYNFDERDPDHSPLTTFLTWLGSGHTVDCPPTKDSLRHKTGFFDMEWSRNGKGYTTDGLQENHWAVLSVMKWPEKSSEALFRSVLSLQTHVTAYMRIRPMSTQKARARVSYNKSQSEVLAKGEKGKKDISKINPFKDQEFTDTLAELGADKDALINTEMCFLVSAETEEELEYWKGQVRTQIVDQVETAVVERGFAQRWYESRWPGRDYFTRNWIFRAKNVADFLYMEASPRGHMQTSWGNRCLRYVPTAGARTPYALSLHVDSQEQGLAHFGIIAGTNSGKSTLFQFLATGALSAYPDMFVLALDNRLGLRVPTGVLGNEATYIMPETDLSFNPLDREDTPANQMDVTAIIAMLAAVDPDDNEQMQLVAKGVAHMMALPRSTRVLKDLYTTAYPPGPIRQALSRWCEGQYARYFNAPLNNFTPEAYRYVGVDMTHLLEDPKLAAAYAYCALRGVSNYASKQRVPHIDFIDEASTMLESPPMQQRVRELLRIERKLEGAVGLAFQEFESVLNSPIASVLRANIGTWFIWPGSANTEAECKAFNFTDWETDFALGRIDKMPGRPVLMTREAESVVIDIDLKPGLGPMLRGYQSGPTNILKMQRAMKESGSGPWLDTFINMP